MEISRRSFLVRAAALASLGGLELFPDAVSGASPHAAGGGAAINVPPVSLRGYGTISAVFRVFQGGQSSLTHITCESGVKARLTQAKYLSDLTRLPGVVKGSLAHGRHTFPVYQTGTGGSVACYAQGHDVLILAAVSKGALASLYQSILPASAQAADFAPRVSVPMYLDRWDKYGLICYFAPEATPPGYSESTYDYSEGLKFARDNGPLGLIVWTNPLTDDYAEGLNNEQAWGWVRENARNMGIPMHINTQISPPQGWLANRFREQTMLKAPQFLGGYYGVAHDSAGVGAISWLSQEAEDIQLGLSQEIVRRCASDPNVVGWLEPHGETAEYPQKYFLDSGPYADEVLRGFLRGRYGPLRAVSERWHGDASHYTSWSDVRMPEIADFAGFGPDAIDLRGAWRVRYVPAPDGHAYTRDEARGLPSPPPIAPVPAAWYRPGFDDSEWDELTAPGNDRMLAMTRSPLVYRRTIHIPAEWLASHSQVTLYVWDMVNRVDDVTTMYVNGHPVKETAQKAGDQHWSRFDVTGALKDGLNLLVMQMPRGIISYRAYLTGELPREYPHLGPQKNAQWADFVAWNIESRGAQIRRGAEMIRQVDPNSSINFMAADDYFEPVKHICQDYGGRFHDTGAMA
ncbi:MAG: hypothetical protein M3Y13_05070, partial [Armatimonadota bacterium]|nr:hypothetical protein [Armatimonadota bacterium]